MKRLILILSILSLLLFGAWGCPEKSDQSQKEPVGAAETVDKKATDTVDTAQTGSDESTEIAKEKAKKVIEDLKVTTQGSTQETKGSE